MTIKRRIWWREHLLRSTPLPKDTLIKIGYEIPLVGVFLNMKQCYRVLGDEDLGKFLSPESDIYSDKTPYELLHKGAINRESDLVVGQRYPLGISVDYRWESTREIKRS